MWDIYIKYLSSTLKPSLITLMFPLLVVYSCSISCFSVLEIQNPDTAGIVNLRLCFLLRQDFCISKARVLKTYGVTSRHCCHPSAALLFALFSILNQKYHFSTSIVQFYWCVCPAGPRQTPRFTIKRKTEKKEKTKRTVKAALTGFDWRGEQLETCGVF